MALQRLMVRITPAHKKAIRKAAKEAKVSESQIVRDLLDGMVSVKRRV